MLSILPSFTMSPARKRKSDSNRHVELAKRLSPSGVPASTDCIRCVLSGSDCDFAERSQRCIECVSLGRTCDSRFSGETFNRLGAEAERLRRQLLAILAQQEKALQKLQVEALRLHTEVQQATGLVQRMATLRDHQTQLVEQEVASLEALDAAEETCPG